MVGSIGIYADAKTRIGVVGGAMYCCGRYIYGKYYQMPVLIGYQYYSMQNMGQFVPKFS